MKKLLAIAVLMGLGSAAHAQEGNSDFSANAEYRVRYQYDQNVQGDKDGISSQNSVRHRLKMGVTFRAGENFSGAATFLHNATWGSDDFGHATAGTGDSAKATLDGTRNAENMILVHEAYGSWMLNDSTTLKFGRGTYTMADGSVIASNDYEAYPYTFEGALITHEMELMRVSAWGVKFAEYDNSGGTADDPEANAYGLSLDFKTLPEVLKMVNIHVIQNQKDETSGSATTAAQLGQSVLRYGATVAGDVAGFDFKLNYAAHNGDLYVPASENKLKSEGMMYQVELGYTLPEIMNSRFYVLYHSDSGDKDSTDDKAGTYDPYFYDMHYNAGLMDIVKWGNLTYISVGYTLMPMDDLVVGLHYHMFERTEAGTNATGVTAGKNGGGLNLGAASNDKSKIGDEIDLVAEKKYENGFSLLARAGMFMPGDYLKDAGTINKSDTYTQIFLQGKMNF